MQPSRTSRCVPLLLCSLAALAAGTNRTAPTTTNTTDTTDTPAPAATTTIDTTPATTTVSSTSTSTASSASTSTSTSVSAATTLASTTGTPVTFDQAQSRVDRTKSDLQKIKVNYTATCLSGAVRNTGTSCQTLKKKLNNAKLGYDAAVEYHSQQGTTARPLSGAVLQPCLP